MDTLFISVLNMSLTASYVIAAIMLVRLFLKKTPKVISYMLWAVAGFRLIFPFSFESIFSLIPFKSQPIPQTTALGENVSFGSAVGAALRSVGDAANGGLGTVTVYLGKTADGYPVTTEAYHSEVWLLFGSYLWLIGIAALLIYSAVSIILLKGHLRGAVLTEGNIYEAENLKTPFVLDFFHPKIYIPSGLSAEEKSYIIHHERTHIRRLDHVVKPTGFLILCVHWFNPLVWGAFLLMSADMEMSCDERVLKEMDGDIKKAYSKSLLSLATGQSFINGSPLAFGEGNIKERIKNVLNFKKPSVWVIAISVVIITVLSVGFAANRATPDNSLPRDYKPALMINDIVYWLSPDGDIKELPKGSMLFGKIKKVSSPSMPPDEESEAINFPESYIGTDIYISEDDNKVFVKREDKKGYIVLVAESIMNGPSSEAYSTEYDRVKIEFLSQNKGFMSANEFEATDLKIVAYIDSTIRNSLPSVKEAELNKNYIKQYTIKLSNDLSGYSCVLYYDTRHNKAYIVKDGGPLETGTDFARYIDSFLENTDSTFHIDDADAVALFQTYGWTLDYQLSAMKNKLNNISALYGFNPNAWYFAYNNELSKDIGLDMSRYSDSADIDVEIYRIHESMPQEFYPIQNCRGIVVKSSGEIIGAFISAGRHSTFNACSLKGNSFEKATGQTLDEWLVDMLIADDTDERLSKLEPEQVVEEYFTALGNKDAQTGESCISKKMLLGNLTTNMPNNELFNEGMGLLLTDSNFDNLKSAKLLKVELIDQSDKNTKTFRVTVNLQYNEVVSIGNGEQSWDCGVVFESPQTGWKIAGFGRG